MFANSAQRSAAEGMEQIRSREPTPEFAAEFVETFDAFFSALDDPSLRDVVTLRFEGYTDSEIAERLDYSRRTVQRKLVIVRRHWTRLELSHE